MAVRQRSADEDVAVSVTEFVRSRTNRLAALKASSSE